MRHNECKFQRYAGRAFGRPRVCSGNNVGDLVLMLEHQCNTRRSAMRILPFMLAVFVFPAGIGTSAEAQNYPWCEYLGGGMGGGGGRNCGFISFEQCMDSARGNGNDCRQNTQYVP